MAAEKVRNLPVMPLILTRVVDERIKTAAGLVDSSYGTSHEHKSVSNYASILLALFMMMKQVDCPLARMPVS